MQRTIVTIGDQDGVLTAKLMKADAALPDPRKPQPIGCSPETLPPLDSPANLKAYGVSLRHGLMNHAAIKSVLQGIFSAPPGVPNCLCFDIEAIGGEQIRWEALCDDNDNFLALDGRCHIGRIAEEVSTQDAGVRPFVPPLRIAAFMSAAGQDATPEWKALSAAIDAAASRNLPVQARVYVGQQALLDDIRASIATGAHPAISVDAIPALASGIERVINEWQPHIVHVFCHGFAPMGAAFLQFATVTEHDLGDTDGSILLAIDEMVNLIGLRAAWLIVLNCCQGAKAAAGINSMAYRMVSKGGLAAAIGMQEPVAAGDANAFAAALYPDLLRTLESAMKVAAGVAPVVVNLSEAITGPRRALRNRHLASPADNARWTLPVLYLQDRPLEVFRPAAALSQDDAQRLREKAEMVASFLRSLPPDAPLEIRAKMLALLDQPPVVPAPMRPDSFGTFPSQ